MRSAPKEIKTMNTIRYRVVCASLAAMVLAWSTCLPAAESKKPSEQEAQLVAVLQGSAGPAEKAMACKKLAVYGSQTAAPALAALLADEQLASWARIALEAIPGPACDEVLRDAAARLQGKLAVGAINSLARRYDKGAVEVLKARLKDSDAEVVSAAAAGLGRIGGAEALKTLEQMLPAAPDAVRSAVAEGCILCAEELMNAGKGEQAAALYDAVRKADVPRPRVLEATRGAVLARQEAGVPLVVELLRSGEKDLFNVGLRVARELTCSAVTAAVVAELDKAKPYRQAMMLYALGYRGDAKAAPAVARFAASDNEDVRIAALAALGTTGQGAQVGLLLEAAAGGKAEMPIARGSLKTMPGADVNAALIAQAKAAGEAVRGEAILALATRDAVEAVPLFMECLSARQDAVRQSAVVALRQLAGQDQYADLLQRMMATDSPDVRRSLQDVLVAVSRRSKQPEQCARQLMDAWKKGGPARPNVLEIICWFGRSETLPAVQEALGGQDVEMRKNTLRSLANWPDSSILPKLMDLAANDKDAAVRVLALRAAVPLIGRDVALSADQKAGRFAELMKLAKQADGRKLVLAELKSAPALGSLKLAADQLDDPQTVNEAAVAILDIASVRGLTIKPDDQKPILEKAIQAKINNALRSRLRARLKALSK